MEKRTIISWSIFLVLFLVIVLFSYFYFSEKVLEYRMGICLDEFKESYLKYGIIYEYDSYCKSSFSEYNNFFYCEDYINKDFCVYSFVTFIQNKTLSKSLCSQVLDVKLAKDCGDLFLEI